MVLFFRQMDYRIAGNFRQFRHLLLLAKILSANLLSYINNYIEDMATFTALMRIKCFCNIKVAGLGKIVDKLRPAV